MHIILTLSMCAGVFLIKNFNFHDEKKLRLYQVIWCGTLLFIFAALRAPSVGTDLLGYCNVYKQDAQLTFVEIINISDTFIQSHDPIFHCFLHLLSFVSTDPQFMIVIISLLVAVGISIFIYQHSQDILISFLMFVCLRIFSFTMSGLRQAIAMSILWFAIHYIDKRKPFKFIICVIIATLFHSSAAIFIIAYLLIKIKNIKLFTMMLSSFIIIDVLTPHLPLHLISELPYLDRYSKYLAGEKASTGITTLIVYCIILIFVLLAYKNIAKENEKAAFSYNMMTFGILFSFVGFDFANIFRIGYYFIPYMYIIFPEAINAYFKPKDRFVVKFFVIILLIAQFWIFGPGAGTDEYIFFWQYR